MRKLFFVFLFSFLFIPSVFAVSSGGVEFYPAGNAFFVQNNSLSSYTAVGTTADNDLFYKGYIASTGGANDTFGASVCFSVNTVMVKDYLYNISILLSNDTGNNFDIVTYNNYALLSVGSNMYDARNNYGNTQIYYFNRAAGVNVNNSNYLINGNILNYLFKPTRNADYVCLPFKPEYNVSTNTYFYGFNITSLGYTGGLTDSDISSVITNSGLATSTEINNISASLGQVEIGLHNAIVEENQKTQDAVNNVNDSINNSGVDSEVGSSFFENFTDDNHGLTSIITAPLNLFNSLLSVSPTNCSNLTANYKGKIISLPCGSIFWSHNGISDFATFYNLVVDGALCYLIIRRFWKDIEQLKDPDNDRVEVMDL